MSEIAQPQRGAVIERATGRTRREHDFATCALVIRHEYEITDINQRGERVIIAREWRKQ